AGNAVSAGDSIAVADIADLLYTPAGDANGLAYDAFTFQVQDDGGTSDGGVDLDQSAKTFTINVTSVNDAPAGTDGSTTILEDGSYAFSAADFGFTDPADTTVLNSLQAVTITTLATGGTLTLAGNAVVAGDSIAVADIADLLYTPAGDANGLAYDAFTFQVQDDGGTSDGGVDLDQSANTITINVTSVNDAPAGTDGGTTINEDTPYTFVAGDFGFTDPNDNPANGFQAV